MESFKVSNSSLGSMCKCDTMAVLSKGLKLQAKKLKPAPRAGTGLHVGLAEYSRGKSEKEILNAFLGDYEKYSRDNLDPSSEYWHENLVKVLTGFIRQCPVESLPFTFIDEWTERRGVTVPLDDKGGFLYEFVLDGLGREKGSDELVIIDYKSTKKNLNHPMWFGMFNMDSQFSGYPWAVSKLLGEEVERSYIIGINIKQVPSSDMTCKVHSTKYSECGIYHVDYRTYQTDRSEEQIKSWKRTALKRAKRLRNMCLSYNDISMVKYLETQGTFNNQCSWCDFDEFCKLGRDERHKDELLEDRSY